MYELERKSQGYSLFTVLTNDKFAINELAQKITDFGGENLHNVLYVNELEIMLECRGLLLSLLSGISEDYQVLAKRNAQQRNFRPIYKHETQESYFAA